MPPGNVRGETAWTRRARAAKPEIKLTPGKGAADLTVPLEDILDAIVKHNRVRAASNAELCKKIDETQLPVQDHGGGEIVYRHEHAL